MPGPLYPIQPVFARGELSPRLFSRVDVDHWKMGLAECVNWLVMKQGGLRRRPGTEWISFGKYPGQKCRLQRFVFSTLQAYVIEFGAYYLRIYANGGIVNRNAATGITFVLPNTVHWPGHGLAANYPVMFSTQGTLPAPLVPGLTYYVTGGDANGFQISTAPGGSVITFTTAGSGVHSAVAPVEIATPYDIDHVWKLQFSQSADVLYIASQDFEPRMLSRFSGSTFQLVVYSGYDGPYLPDNTTATTMTAGRDGWRRLDYRQLGGRHQRQRWIYMRLTSTAGSACNTPASGTPPESIAVTSTSVSAGDRAWSHRRSW